MNTPSNAGFSATLPRPEYLPTEQGYRSLEDIYYLYKPDMYEQLIKSRADQTLAGMLDMFGSKEAIQSDKAYWAEEGVRHFVYSGVTITVSAGDDEAELDFSAAIGDNNYVAYGENDLVAVVSAADVDDKIIIGVVKQGSIDDTAHTLTVIAQSAADWDDITDAGEVTTFKVGSNYGKGTDGASRSVSRTLTQYYQVPCISKDHWEANNSDLTAMTFFPTPEGDAYWWMGDVEETELRFKDDIEKKMVMGRANVNTTIPAEYGNVSTGLFETLEERGGLIEGYPVDLDDFKTITKYLNSVDGEGVNTMLCDMDSDYAVDEMIMTMGGNAGYDSTNTKFGRYFGDFENGKKIFDFSFKGFQVGSYAFAKQGWKLLRSHQMLGNPVFEGHSSKINCLFTPAGDQNVWDSSLGNNKKAVPYLTKLYKASPFYSREFEREWRGTQGTQSIVTDKTTCDFRSEQALRVVAAEKFVSCIGANA
jgi:hypothetical protein